MIAFAKYELKVLSSSDFSLVYREVIHKDYVTNLKVLENLIYTSSLDKTVQIRNLNDGTLVRVFNAERGISLQIIDGIELIGTHFNGVTVYNSEEPSQFSIASWEHFSVSRVQVYNNWIISAGGNICLWVNRKDFSIKERVENPFTITMFQIVGDYAISSTEDCQAHLWSLTSKSVIQTFLFSNELQSISSTFKKTIIVKSKKDIYKINPRKMGDLKKIDTSDSNKIQTMGEYLIYLKDNSVQIYDLETKEYSMREEFEEYVHLVKIAGDRLFYSRVDYHSDGLVEFDLRLYSRLKLK